MSSWACFFSGNCMLLQGFFVYFSKVCMFESPRSERVNGRGFCWYLSFSHFWPLAVWDLSCTHCLFMSISIKTCLRPVRCLLNCYTNDHNPKLFGPCVPRRDVSPIIEITELKKSKERNYWDKTELKKSKERMQTREALVPNYWDYRSWEKVKRKDADTGGTCAERGMQRMCRNVLLIILQTNIIIPRWLLQTNIIILHGLV